MFINNLNFPNSSLKPSSITFGARTKTQSGTESPGVGSMLTQQSQTIKTESIDETFTSFPAVARSSSRDSTPGLSQFVPEPARIRMKKYAGLKTQDERDEAFEEEIRRRERIKKQAATEPVEYKASIRTEEKDLDRVFLPALNWSSMPKYKKFIAQLEQGICKPEKVTNILANYPYFANLEDEHGVTPFMVAVFSNKPQVVEAFLDSGAIDLTHLDHKGNTALHWLAQPPTAAEIAAEKKAAKALPTEQEQVAALLVAKNRPEEYASNFIKIVEMLKPTIKANRSVFCQKNEEGKSISNYVDSYMTNAVTRKKLAPIHQYFADLELEDKAEKKLAKAISILSLPKTLEQVGSKKRKKLPEASLPEAKRTRRTGNTFNKDISPETSASDSYDSENDFVTGKGSQKKQDPDPFRRGNYTHRRERR
jgi:Ankyrin repeat